MGKNNNEKKAKQNKPKQSSESMSGDGTKTYQNSMKAGKPSDGSF